jgi:cephalosporin hydroxylase
VQEFLKENRDFAPDFSREKFRLTYNPSGYLMRTK